MNARLNFAGLSTSGLGVMAGLSTAVLWTATAVCFEASSRRLGSLSVNVLRLAFPDSSGSCWATCPSSKPSR